MEGLENKTLTLLFRSSEVFDLAPVLSKEKLEFNQALILDYVYFRQDSVYQNMLNCLLPYES